MIPHEKDLRHMIMDEDGVVDGNGGLAIGDTEKDAWDRAIGTDEQWAVDRAKEYGMKVRRCAIMVINP